MTIELNWEIQNISDVWVFEIARDALYILAAKADSVHLRTPASGNNYSELMTAPVGHSGVPGIGINASGQYQVISFATAYVGYPSYIWTGPTYVSDDYGENWSLVTTQDNISLDSKISISDNGQYMIAPQRNTGFLYSTNYGQTWSAMKPSVINSSSASAISGNGQYMRLVGYYVEYSNSYGSGWAESEIDDSELSFSPYSVTMPKDGSVTWTMGAKYVVDRYESQIWKSTNYCLSWSKVTTFPVSESTSSEMISSGENGEILFATDGPQAWLSEDGGDTFEEVTGLPDGVDIMWSGIGNNESTFGIYNWTTKEILLSGLGLIKAVSSQDFPAETKAVATILKANIKAISSQSNS